MKIKLSQELRRGKNFSLFFLMRSLGEGLFYILPLVAAGFLSSDEFGNFSLTQMIVIIVATVLITSSQTPFVVYANRECGESNKINKAFTINFYILIAALIIGVLGLVIFKSLLAKFTGTSAHYYFIIFFYFGITTKTFVENLFIALDKKKANAAYAFVLGIINISTVILFQTTIGVQIHLIFLSYFTSALIATILFFPIIPARQLLPLRFDKKLFKQTIKWIKWQIFGLLAVQLINWGDNFVLRYFVTFKEIGEYNVAYQIFKGLIGLTLIINTYFLPFIVKNIDDKAKIQNYLKSKRLKIFIAGTLLVIILFIISPYLFKWFYDDRYLNSIGVFRVLIIGVCFHLFSVFYIPLINALEKYRFAQINSIFTVIVNLLLDAILIPHFGIMGAAIATTIAYLVCLVNYELFFRFSYSKNKIE